MDDEKSHENLLIEIQTLKEELRERKANLPAHSIRPHQLLAIEDLEEKIQSLERKAGTLDDRKGKKE